MWLSDFVDLCSVVEKLLSICLRFLCELLCSDVSIWSSCIGVVVCEIFSVLLEWSVGVCGVLGLRLMKKLFLRKMCGWILVVASLWIGSVESLSFIIRMVVLVLCSGLICLILLTSMFVICIGELGWIELVDWNCVLSL